MRSTWLLHLWWWCRTLVLLSVSLAHPNLQSCLMTPSLIGWICCSRHITQWVAPGLGLSFLQLSLSICWHRGIKCHISDIGQNVIYCLVLLNLYEPSMLTPTNTFDNELDWWKVSLLRDWAVGARVIQASAHVHLACGGAVKLLPYALTWSLTQVDSDFLPRGAGLCVLPY